MTKVLTLAQHSDPAQYWEGGNYELNLSFDMLRDKQWQRILQVVWDDPALFGPLNGRYTPGGEVPEKIDIQVPPPTATLTQHGQIKIGELVVGCDVQATRSLFECVSILVPAGMFEGITASSHTHQDQPALVALDKVMYDIALRMYDVVPFKIAAIGYERGCQLQVELKSDAVMRHAFLVGGNFLAQDDVLSSIEPDISRYEQIRPNLRWMGPTIAES